MLLLWLLLLPQLFHGSVIRSMLDWRRFVVVVAVVVVAICEPRVRWLLAAPAFRRELREIIIILLVVLDMVVVVVVVVVVEVVVGG